MSEIRKANSSWRRRRRRRYHNPSHDEHRFHTAHTTLEILRRPVSERPFKRGIRTSKHQPRQSKLMLLVGGSLCQS